MGLLDRLKKSFGKEVKHIDDNNIVDKKETEQSDNGMWNEPKEDKATVEENTGRIEKCNKVEPQKYEQIKMLQEEISKQREITKGFNEAVNDVLSSREHKDMLMGTYIRYNEIQKEERKRQEEERKRQEEMKKRQEEERKRQEEMKKRQEEERKRQKEIEKDKRTDHYKLKEYLGLMPRIDKVEESEGKKELKGNYNGNFFIQEMNGIKTIDYGNERLEVLKENKSKYIVKNKIISEIGTIIRTITTRDNGKVKSFGSLKLETGEQADLEAYQENGELDLSLMYLNKKYTMKNTSSQYPTFLMEKIEDKNIIVDEYYAPFDDNFYIKKQHILEPNQKYQTFKPHDTSFHLLSLRAKRAAYAKYGEPYTENEVVKILEKEIGIENIDSIFDKFVEAGRISQEMLKLKDIELEHAVPLLDKVIRQTKNLTLQDIGKMR